MRLLRLPPLAPDPAAHEGRFLEHYARLRARALALTGHDAGLADDLLHDAFIQFTLVRPPLDGIGNVEAYLIGMLRHLHASHLRRAARRGIAPVPLDELEFLAGDMRALAAAEARQELALLCRYACLRKETSKAGSILILRFMLGYFPSEIARIAHLSAHAVDEWLRLARREARWFRDDPGKLAFLRQTPVQAQPRVAADGPVALAMDDGDPEALLRSLRQAVFAARQGPCLSDAVLRHEYQPPRTAALATPLLAHLVSCPPCLARVCALLSIPNASDRFPGDGAGPGGGSRDGDRAREGAADAARRARKRRNVFEHRPHELCVAVNGLELARCTVGQATTRQALSININEPMAFVEVFSVEGVRLLFASVDPFPYGPVEQTVRAGLSEDRSVELRVRFVEPWPEMEIVYRDPHRPAEAEAAADAAVSDRPDVVLESIAPETAPVSAWWREALGLEWIARIARIARIEWLPVRAVVGAAVVALVLLFAIVGPATVWAALREASVQVLRVLRIVPPAPPRPPLSGRPIASVAPLPSPHVGVASTPAAIVPSRGDRDSRPLIAVEVDVLRRLDAIEALLGREAFVSRQGSRITVQAFGATPARREAIVQALRDLDACRCVTVTSDPLPARPVRSTPTSPAGVREPAARIVESADARFPLQTDVERVFTMTRHVGAAEASHAAQTFAARVLAEARALLLHAGALRDVRNRFSASEMAAMPADTRAAWRAILSGHARDAEQAGATLTASLGPWLSDEKTNEPSAAVPAGFARAEVDRLFAQAVTIDEAVREAFAASPDATDTPTALRLSSRPFRVALDEAHALARRLQLDDITTPDSTTHR